MQNPAISVIIPVYNQEKYVGKCIRSVLGQSFQDSDLVQPVLNGDVNAFLSKVEEREQFLWKHHYWKKRLLRYYQQIADRIGLVIR